MGAIMSTPCRLLVDLFVVLFEGWSLLLPPSVETTYCYNKALSPASIREPYAESPFD